MADGFDASAKAFGHILKGEDGPIVIPRYQREYEWGIEQLEILTNDFLEHFDSWKTTDVEKRTKYFTGTIVVHKHNQQRAIVDGQQRLTTITVMLCALRDIINCHVEGVNLGANELRDDEWLKHPLHDSTMALDTVEKKIVSMINETETADRVVHLQLKQQDSPRLDWIRLPWREKATQLCPRTFEWRKKEGSAGLPNQHGNKPKDIYAVYLEIWSKFGLLREGETPFDELGVLCVNTVEGEAVSEEVHPFMNTGKDKQIAWSHREFDQLKPTFQRIAELVFTIHDLAKVIQLDVKDQWMAHVIFDRANTAGKKLAMFDVIRAKSFACLARNHGDDTDEETLHTEMEKIYKHSPKKTEINEFVKHFATMNEGRKITGSGTRTYYTEKFEEINTKADLMDYAKLFVESFDKYHTLLAKPDLNACPTSWIAAYSRMFNFTKFKQHRPLLLKAIVSENTGDEHILKLQKCVESIYIIHNLLMGGSPSEIETMMADQINEITDDDSIDEVIKSLANDFMTKSTFNQKKGIPLDKVSFMNAVRERAFTNSQAHFILRNKYQNDAPNINANPINITDALFGQVEHVLPEKPNLWGDPWYRENNATELHGEYYQKIGNLTLLDATINSSISNKPWSDKKTSFIDVKNPEMTKQIGRNATWNTDEINARTEEMAEFITERWWNIFENLIVEQLKHRFTEWLQNNSNREPTPEENTKITDNGTVLLEEFDDWEQFFASLIE